MLQGTFVLNGEFTVRNQRFLLLAFSFPIRRDQSTELQSAGKENLVKINVFQ